jgi:SAM-dependent methyltransferase
MEGFDPKTSFGYEISKRYVVDEARGDEEETVAFFARLAGQHDALEFAIGAGRIALPLARAGVQVDGIEQSRHMLDRLREKPGGESVHAAIGDMASVSMGRTYGLVYLVYNTIGNLLTQDEQVRCFENAARHLTDAGVFVLECRVPTAATRSEQQFVEAEQVAADRVTLHVGRYEPVTQILDANHVHIDGDGISFGPISLRLAYPAEFDLMARIAGLRLRHRFGGWHGEPFTSTSWRHVSVYEPARVRARSEAPSASARVEAEA